MRALRLLLPLLMIFAFPSSPSAQEADRSWADVYASKLFGQAIADGRASSAVVTIVQDGKVLVNQGYGFADHPSGRAADAARDRYLIASCTKTFTAAAIALLVEDGRIRSLDDPANTYLTRVKLPAWRGKAITLRQLLTHSAGFEERGFGVVRPEPAPDEGYLRSAIPAVVREPGTRIVYANIDPAILGLVVEDVAHQPLQRFLERRLLRPLGMTSTVLNLDPHPQNLVRLWKGSDADIAYAPVMMNSAFFAPTGSIQTTGADMARYLGAMLGERPDVLSPTVVAMLGAPLMRNDPALPSLGMNWFLPTWNGHQVIEHSGAFSGFNAWIVLIPETRTALFAVWGGGPARPEVKTIGYGEVRDGFLRAAVGPDRIAPPASPARDVTIFAGRYWKERRPHNSPEVLLFLDSVSTVSASGLGSLMIDAEGPYREASPGVFRFQPTPDAAVRTVVFRGEEMLSAAGYAKRVSGLSDPRRISHLALLLVALCLTGLLAPSWRRWAAIAGVTAAAGALLIPAVLMAGPSALEADILNGRPWRFLVLLGAGLVLAASSLALAAGGVRLGRSATTPAWIRRLGCAHFLVLSGAAAGLAAILAWANVLNAPHLN